MAIAMKLFLIFVMMLLLILKSSIGSERDVFTFENINDANMFLKNATNIEKSSEKDRMIRIDINLKKTIVDRKLDLNEKIPDLHRELHVRIMNNKGLFLNSTGLIERRANESLKNCRILLILNWFRFDLFDSNENLIDLSTTDVEKFDGILSVDDSIRVDLIVENNNFISEKLSPIMFNNTKLRSLRMFGFTNVSMRRYHLKFRDNPKMSATKIISRIESIMIFDAYKICLNRELLNLKLTMQTWILRFSGKLESIEETFFIDFRFLRNFNLRLSNTREFWHSSSDHKWLTYLNGNISFDLSNIDQLTNEQMKTLNYEHVLIEIDSDEYNYPNEDICLFRLMPFNQLVFLFINRDRDLKRSEEDTCTIKFLYKYLKLIQFNHKIHFIIKSDLNCDLERMLALCNTSTAARVETKSHSTDMVLFEFVLAVIFMPITSAIGFMLNLF